MTGEAKRIVVRAPNWLGDAVMSLPAIAAVRRHFSDAHLSIAAPASVAALFREDIDAAPDRVIELPRGTRDAVATLEGEGFDLGILFPNSFRSAWQFRRAGIRERWGYARAGRWWLLTRRSVPPKAGGTVHQAEDYRRLVVGLGIGCDSQTLPRVAARAPSSERARALLAQRGVDPAARLVGFAPGAAYGQAKQWPPERMAEVMARLVTQDDVTCVVVGASHDRDAARAIESWLRANAPAALPRVVDLTGQTSLGGLIGLVERMITFVSNDSGAMHLAAALGRPVVAIFGPTDERATGPLGDHTVLMDPVFCRPCMLRDCPIDHRCMKRISVENVEEATRARLLAGVG